MWPQVIAAIAPVLLGEFMNHNRHRRGPDLEELRRRALAELDPTRISQEAGRQELELLNSPGTHAMRSQLIQAGQMGTNAINQRLAQTGLGRSGVGMALESGVRAAPGIQDAMLTSQLLATARDRALQMQKMRADAQMAGGMMPDDPNYMAQMLGAVISAGMGPLIEHSFGKGKTTPKKAEPYTPTPKPINPITGARFGATTPYAPSPFASKVGMPMTNASGWTMPPSEALNAAGMAAAQRNNGGFVGPYRASARNQSGFNRLMEAAHPKRIEPDLPVYADNNDWLRRTMRPTNRSHFNGWNTFGAPTNNFWWRDW